MSREHLLEKSIGTDALVSAQTSTERRTARWKHWSASGTCVSLGIAGYLFVLAPFDNALSAQRESRPNTIQTCHSSAGITSAADKREAKKAEREAKKAERAAKKEERDAARAAKKDEQRAAKSHSKAGHDDDSDQRTASKGKASKSSGNDNVDLGGNDPLEGL